MYYFTRVRCQKWSQAYLFVNHIAKVGIQQICYKNITTYVCG